MNLAQAEPISRESYAPYGDVIDDASGKFKWTNQGTAKRYDFLCDIRNCHAGDARLNVCVFDCSPVASWPLKIGLLEKHPYSTQVFVPMNGVESYLLAVALGGETPELSTLKFFLVSGRQSISYHPGVWHHPMLALGNQSLFTCLVWEEGGSADCVVSDLLSPVSVSNPLG